MLNIVQQDFELGYSKITLCVYLSYFGQLSNEYTAQFSWIVQLKFATSGPTLKGASQNGSNPDFKKIEPVRLY